MIKISLAIPKRKVNLAKDIKDGLKDAKLMHQGKRPIVLARDFLKELENQ